MSYTVEPQQPGRTRPTVVGAAVALLYAIAGLLLVNAIIGAINNGNMKAAMDEVYSGMEGGDTAATVVSASLWVSVVLNVLLAVGFVILAIFDGQGKQGARVTTWVFAGIGALCCGCGSLANGLTNNLNSMVDSQGSNAANAPTTAEVQAAMDAHVPSWYTPVSSTIAILLALACIAVIVLLALPAANPFFRKEADVWVPPTAWTPNQGATPGYPGTGYPQQPPADTPNNGLPGAQPSDGSDGEPKPPAPPA
jgi:hypothetical protein